MTIEYPIRGTAYVYERRYKFDGVPLTLAFAWHERLACYHVDAIAADGSVLFVGQRLTPGALLFPDRSIPGLPPGVIAFTGPDPYAMSQVGSDVRMIYVTVAEMAAL